MNIEQESDLCIDNKQLRKKSDMKNEATILSTKLN